MDIDNKILLNMAINNVELHKKTEMNAGEFITAVKSRFKVYAQIHKEVQNGV